MNYKVFTECLNCCSINGCFVEWQAAGQSEVIVLSHLFCCFMFGVQTNQNQRGTREQIDNLDNISIPRAPVGAKNRFHINSTNA